MIPIIPDIRIDGILMNPQYELEDKVENLFHPKGTRMEKVIKRVLSGVPSRFIIQFHIKDNPYQTFGDLKINSDGKTLEVEKFEVGGDQTYLELVEQYGKKLQERLFCCLEERRFEPKVKQCFQAIQLFFEENSFSFRQAVNEAARECPS